MKFWPLWKKKSVTSASSLGDLLATSSSKTGANVNWQTALQASTAYACARVIAEDLAQVPLKVYQSRSSDGGADIIREHPLYSVLHDAPNEWQTSYDWRLMTGLHLVFAGNSFSYIVRTMGQVNELIPFEPGQVTMKRIGNETEYKVKKEDGTDQVIPPGEMLHIHAASWDGWKGLDGIKMARESIGLSLAAEEHATRLFSNGARPSGILSTDANLTKEQIGLLRDSWDQTHGGVANAYKTAVLFGGMSFTPLAMQNDSAQMVELRNQQVEEVCRAMKVMPIMVGHSDKASTYASAEQMFLAHATRTMGPWYANLEQRFNKSLLTPEERADGIYTKFLSQAIMRGAHKDRAEFYTALYNVGALNPNEIRSMEEMNPYTGGDEYRVPLNMAEPGQITEE